MRKIIQIAACQSEDDQSRTLNCFALCDDGTLWNLSTKSSKPGLELFWEPVLDIPQDDEK